MPHGTHHTITETREVEDTIASVRAWPGEVFIAIRPMYTETMDTETGYSPETARKIAAAIAQAADDAEHLIWADESDPFSVEIIDTRLTETEHEADRNAELGRRQIIEAAA